MTMTTLDIVAICAISFSITLICVLRLALWLHGRRKRRVALAEADLPGISILKPLKGADPELEANLESFLRLDYPKYELLLATVDEHDPAYGIALRVIERNPGKAVKLVTGPENVCLNPKVRLLARIAREAQYGIFLISDSNVHTPPDYLRDMAAAFADPKVGLVTTPFRGVGGKTLAAKFEALHLNTYVVQGMLAANELIGQVVVIGKSMAFYKADLGTIGGWEHIGAHLGEDQVCGEDIRKLGRKIAVQSVVLDNVIGDIKVRDFIDRHARWAVVRSRIVPLAYLNELWLNPVPVSLIFAAIAHSWYGLIAAASAINVKALLDFTAERQLGVKRNVLLYPFLVTGKDLFYSTLWFYPLVRNWAVWRGDHVACGARSRLKTLNKKPLTEYQAQSQGRSVTAA